MTDASDDPLLALATRRRIYRRIQEAPGLHFRALQRDLSLSVGTLEYNLYQMERQGLVVVREEAGFKSYFPRDELDRRDRDVLHYLRQRTTRRLALEITEQPGIRFQELRARLGILPSALSHQLRRLVQAGIVEEERVGREKAYRCLEPERVRRLVVQYRATFLDQLVDRFAATWVDL
jgi:predicted transcriptional regulator